MPGGHASQHCLPPCFTLEQLCSADMRQDVQEIFKGTPHEKQVMMFSATLSDQMRPVCRRFMDNVSSSAGGMAA